MPAAAPTVEVAAGLIVRDGKILIAKRLVDAAMGGLWEFPGGKRQADESFEACLKREVMEELGLTVAVHEQVASAEHHDPQYNIRLRFYRCTVLAGKPSAIGCEVFCWVTPAEISGFSFPPADLQLVQQIASGRYIIV